MPREKLSDVIGGFRIESGKTEKLDAALQFFCLDRAGFFRRCVAALIEHSERGDRLEWPLEFAAGHPVKSDSKQFQNASYNVSQVKELEGELKDLKDELESLEEKHRNERLVPSERAQTIASRHRFSSCDRFAI
jgi:hypothetical protein